MTGKEYVGNVTSGAGASLVKWGCPVLTSWTREKPWLWLRSSSCCLLRCSCLADCRHIVIISVQANILIPSTAVCAPLRWKRESCRCCLRRSESGCCPGDNDAPPSSRSLAASLLPARTHETHAPSTRWQPCQTPPRSTDCCGCAPSGGRNWETSQWQ